MCNLGKAVTLNSPAAPRRSQTRIALVVGALALAAIAVAYFFLSLLPHTFTRIMPLSGSRSSTSMDLAEYALLSSYKNLKALPKDAPPIAWQLKLPEAYLLRETGSPDCVYVPSKCSYFLNFLTVIDRSSGTLSPASLAPPDIQIRNAVGISLENGPQAAEISSGNHCIRADDYEAFMKSKGGRAFDWRCQPTVQRCRIHTHLDGWPISISVPRNLYEKPEEICTAMKQFLDEHTKHRDKAWE